MQLSSGEEGWSTVDAFLDGFVTAPALVVPRCATECAHERASELLIDHIFSSAVRLARGDKFLRSLTSARSGPLAVVVNLVPGPYPPSLLGQIRSEGGTWSWVAYNPKAKRVAAKKQLRRLRGRASGRYRSPAG